MARLLKLRRNGVKKRNIPMARVPLVCLLLGLYLISQVGHVPSHSFAAFLGQYRKVQQKPAASSDPSGPKNQNEVTVPYAEAIRRIQAGEYGIGIKEEYDNGDSSLSLANLKILLYITSHFSVMHIDYFKHCWKHAIEESPLLQNVDTVLVYDNHKEGEISGNLTPTQIITSVFDTGHHNVTILRQSSVTAKQDGANQAMVDAFQKGWFQSYDWVIRLQPDAMIHNDTLLVKHMLSGDVDGIFSPCGCMIWPFNGPKCKKLIQDPNRLNKKYWLDPCLNTDFQMFRPAALPHNITWGLPHKKYFNTENKAGDVFGPIVSSGRAAYIENEFQWWRIEGGTVRHNHDMVSECKTQLSKDKFADYDFVGKAKYPFHVG